MGLSLDMGFPCGSPNTSNERKPKRLDFLVTEIQPFCYRESVSGSVFVVIFQNLFVNLAEALDGRRPIVVLDGFLVAVFT